MTTPPAAPLLPVCLLFLPALHAADLPRVDKSKVELQPLAAQAKRRFAEALIAWGRILPEVDRKAFADAADTDAIQAVLDKRCLAGVHIDNGPSLRVQAGPASTELAEQGWRGCSSRFTTPPGSTTGGSRQAARTPLP